MQRFLIGSLTIALGVVLGMVCYSAVAAWQKKRAAEKSGATTPWPQESGGGYGGVSDPYGQVMPT